MINSSSSKVVLLAREAQTGVWKTFGPYRNVAIIGKLILVNDQCRSIGAWHTHTNRWLLIDLTITDSLIVEAYDPNLPIQVTEL